jgi:hypothetical protein
VAGRAGVGGGRQGERQSQREKGEDSEVHLL